MKTKIFSGVCTALITPFKNGRVDYNALNKLIDLQLKAKVDAIVVLGTTGESPCISANERENIIKFCRKKISDCKLIVGTGSNNTKTAIKYTKQAQKLGADAALVVTPYYNKCTQNGLIEHYSAIAKNTSLPIILYNVPTRTGVNILPETAKKLSQIENVVAIKEANPDLEHVNKMFLSVLDKLYIYCGNDNLNCYFYSLGASGAISVTSNIFPDLVKQQYNCFLAGDDGYKQIDQQLKNLNDLMFKETNPIGVKFCANYLGLCQNELRLPLTPLNQKYHAPIIAELKKLAAHNPLQK